MQRFFKCDSIFPQKRNDREEIRRRLAMGAEDDYLTKISTAKPGRKPSLQTRLQEGMKQFSSGKFVFFFHSFEF